MERYMGFADNGDGCDTYRGEFMGYDAYYGAPDGFGDLLVKILQGRHFIQRA